MFGLQAREIHFWEVPCSTCSVHPEKVQKHASRRMTIYDGTCQRARTKSMKQLSEGPLFEENADLVYVSLIGQRGRLDTG